MAMLDPVATAAQRFPAGERGFEAADAGMPIPFPLSGRATAPMQRRQPQRLAVCGRAYAGDADVEKRPPRFGFTPGSFTAGFRFCTKKPLGVRHGSDIDDRFSMLASCRDFRCEYPLFRHNFVETSRWFGNQTNYRCLFDGFTV
ncbi:hypothetical protein [Burkholderia pseudomallei]|uniref:hypothetical protein n=1 Tax=Burkholderia pseudomallei TaxID=28450 RepID=UPI00128F3448|nr:hypothetical protein [Burkholderia pseudomallei]